MSKKIQDGWVSHLRRASRPQGDNAAGERTRKCPSCSLGFPHDVTIEAFRNHCVEKHGSPSEPAIAQAFDKMTLGSTPVSSKRPVCGTGRAGPTQTRGGSEPDDEDERDTKRIRSPPASDMQRVSSHRNSTPGRTGAWPLPDDFDHRRHRRPHSGRQLFDPEQDPTRPKSSQKSSRRGGRMHQQPRTVPSAEVPDPIPIPVDPNRPNTHLVPQLETKAISHEQLVAEAKSIYTGLATIESRCIEVVTAQSSNTDHQLSGEQWQALIALHRTLLHEHHDFFLATQHPVASEALNRLAAKYAMPARMWRHGIHSFLELLRHKLPHSLDQMLTFIYLAYSMMALLYETVTAFRDVWIECLGDLARYRMAIEETDVQDRETWTNVARSWYCKASNKAPTTGRLYHHLAILARAKAVPQLYFYVKSLCVPIPFATAKESIMSLFDPLLSEPPDLPAVDDSFVLAHAILFSNKRKDLLDKSIDDYLKLLDGEIGRVTKRWLEYGYYTGVSLACAVLGYGDEDHFLSKIIRQGPEEIQTSADPAPKAKPDENFPTARRFMMKSYEVAIRRWGDPNTLPFLHTILAFMFHCSRYPTAMDHLKQQFPWKLTAVMLNNLYRSCKFDLRIDSEEFPGPVGSDTPRPLPEDYAMRGLVYTEEYYPVSWFRDSKVEEDEKYFELASMMDARKERLLWIGRRVASSGLWLTWNEDARKFGVTEPYSAAADDVVL